jgi:hypothetical protein
MHVIVTVFNRCWSLLSSSSEGGELMDEEPAKRLALALAALCVRNTCIEDVHAGVAPSTQTGDHSDVKVVTPYGEIPWMNASRISDDEMRQFMKQVVDRIYTVLLRLDDPQFIERMDQHSRRMTYKWDHPQNLVDWFTGNWSANTP